MIINYITSINKIRVHNTLHPLIKLRLHYSTLLASIEFSHLKYIAILHRPLKINSHYLF